MFNECVPLTDNLPWSAVERQRGALSQCLYTWAVQKNSVCPCSISTFLSRKTSIWKGKIMSNADTWQIKHIPYTQKLVAEPWCASNHTEVSAILYSSCIFLAQQRCATVLSTQCLKKYTCWRLFFFFRCLFILLGTVLFQYLFS